MSVINYFVYMFYFKQLVKIERRALITTEFVVISNDALDRPSTNEDDWSISHTIVDVLDGFEMPNESIQSDMLIVIDLSSERRTIIRIDES